MMEEMMSACCGKDGKPDFEKMKVFMEKCGKADFTAEETSMMKKICCQEGKPDVEKMKEMMGKCGCRVPEATA